MYMYSYDHDDDDESHFTNRVYMPRVRGNIIRVLTVKTEIILWRKEGRNLYPLTRLAGTSYWIHCSSYGVIIDRLLRQTCMSKPHPIETVLCMLLGQITD